MVYLDPLAGVTREYFELAALRGMLYHALCLNLRRRQPALRRCVFYLHRWDWQRRWGSQRDIPSAQ